MGRGSIFRSWLPDAVIKACLVCCTLPSMVLLGLYNSNATYTAGYLGVEPEDMQFIMSVTYGALIATMMIEDRFYRYFATRNYLLGISILSVLVLLASAYERNYSLFLFLRVLEGILMALPGGVMIQLLLGRFHSEGGRIMVYSFFYCVLLCSPAFIATLAAWAIDRLDWQYMVYAGIAVQIAGIALILLLFNGNRNVRKMPLYQVDWPGFLLILVQLLAGTYIFVYGEKKYWLHDTGIRICMVVLLVFTGLFIIRQLHARRPIFDMEVLKVANLRSGLLLFIVLYTGRATLNICHTVMGQVWNWEPSYIAAVQWVNAAGVVAGVIASAFLVLRRFPIRFIFAIGFMMMAIYLIWFTFLFKTDVGLMDIAIPYALQGVSVGFIFSPLVLFISSSLPGRLAQFAPRAGASARFWGTSIGFCIMQNAQVLLQRRHYIWLQQYVSGERPLTQELLAQRTGSWLAKGFDEQQSVKLAFKQMDNAARTQSMLLADMEIFTALGIFLIIFSVLLVFNRHMRQSFSLFRNKIFGY